MHSVKYREFDIPIFYVQNYSLVKVSRDIEYLNYDVIHPSLYDLDVSFFDDGIDGFSESLLSKLDNVPVLFYNGYIYKLFHILRYVSNVSYTIADFENIGGVINIVNYNFKAKISDLDYNSVFRCIKIQNILNH